MLIYYPSLISSAIFFGLIIINLHDKNFPSALLISLVAVPVLLFLTYLSQNKLDKMMKEEKKLASMIDNDSDNNPDKKNIKLFHTLTISEVVDNLSLSIVMLFQQIYTLDYIGLMNSQDNFIYYGFILILSYIILNMFWNQLNDS